MENQTINNPQMSSEMFAIAYEYKMDPALLQPSVSVITPIKNDDIKMYKVKFIPGNNINGSEFKELISKKITQYDVMYIRKKLVNKVEYKSSYSNGITYITHSSLDLIKDVARELRDIYKIDFKLKLVKNVH